MFSPVTFTLLVSAAAAAGTNRTIDDEFGDSVTGLSPLYLLSATAGWGYGPTCIICKVKPEASGCYNGSWHDATASPGELAGVSLSFNGTYTGCQAQGDADASGLQARQYTSTASFLTPSQVQTRLRRSTSHSPSMASRRARSSTRPTQPTTSRTTSPSSRRPALRTARTNS
jgi:hypothetical protein